MAAKPRSIPILKWVLTSSLKMATPTAVVTTTNKEVVMAMILPSQVVERGIPTRNLDINIWTEAMNIIGEKVGSWQRIQF